MVERLPEEIGKLKQLKSLYARNSRIRELPRKIRKLECLERLYVGNTLMAELPEEIGELQKLKIVDVRDIQAEGGSAPTVTLATGALGPVLAKLEALLLRQMGLGDDNFPNLDEGSQSDIESIISELKPLQAFLLRVWEREEDMEEWMADARKLSYDMEDDIDGFLLGFGVQHQHGSRTITTSPFERIKLRVRGLFYRYCVEWNDHVDRITTSMASRSKSKAALGDLDPRCRFLHKDALELMEMDEKKAEVIELLQEHKLVCILGFAGMGKTTLVDQVYQAKGEEFQCRAFVSVSPRPNMKQILSTILSEVTAYKTRYTQVRYHASLVHLLFWLRKHIINLRYNYIKLIESP
jgi:Leucine-rich repeat (LRR) protein